MDLATPVDLATRRRILRRLVGQTYAIVAFLLIAGLAFTPSSTPLWVRGAATAAVLAFGAVVSEVWVRLATRRYPSMQVPVSASFAGALLASLSGFTIALGVQRLLGYPFDVTWVIVLEAVISAPVWLVFIGGITAARARFLSARSALLEELLRIENARAVEREALARARAVVADSVRPNLVELRAQIDTVLTAAPSEHRQAAEELRESASGVLRPLSHELYSQGEAQTAAPRTAGNFLLTVVRTQAFRPGLVSTLYLATAMPANVGLYGFVDALVALSVDVVFIVAILGGANAIMRKAPTIHAWVYVGTLVFIHAIPLVFAPSNVAETDPQFEGVGVLVEIAASLLLIVGTSSLKLLADQRATTLAELQSGVRVERVAEFAEATVLAEAARELGAQLHGPVQSTVLASAAALEAAVSAEETARAHAVLADAAAVIDEALDGGATQDDRPGLVARLAEVAEPWDEICPVHLDVDGSLADLHGEPAEAVAAVVRESITNAFRHGAAGRVEVRVSGGDPMISVVVSDDGSGPGPKNWGLGLTIIDRATEGRWTLTRQADRTVLLAEIARPSSN